MGNIANNNDDHGIHIEWNCDDNTISGNTVNNNTDYGIFLESNSNCYNNNITDNYIYFNTIGAIRIFSADCFNTLIKENILVSIDENFIADLGTNTIKKYNYYGMKPPSFIVEVIAQSFSITEFIVTINISSQWKYIEDSDISFQTWWNGTTVPSNNITELGYGLYNISLTPILVEPDKNPILLNMTISALYHSDRYYDLKLKVDPEAVGKDPGAVPTLSDGGGSGSSSDDDDVIEVTIPFGNYFIVFAVFSIIALVIFRKRQIIYNSRK